MQIICSKLFVVYAERKFFSVIFILRRLKIIRVIIILLLTTKVLVILTPLVSMFNVGGTND